MPLISIRELTKLYRMGDSIVHALDGVDLSIERGEFIAITGPSGSGKSTMMHLLGCLDRPTGGVYMLDGRHVSNLSDRQLAAVRNKQIGFVFQTFNLINRTSAQDNVAVPLFYARKAQVSLPARRALERVGLTKRAHHRPSELSGGERQRVAIARAIVNDPVLLLADEPTGNLDSRTGQQIMQIFHDLNAQGVTIVLVTHEPDVAMQARRIVQMRDGKIVSDRPTAEALAQEGHLIPKAPPIAIDDPAAAPEPEARPAEARMFTPRLMRGANSVLLCSFFGPALYAASAISMAILTSGLDLKTMDPKNIPGRVVAVGLAAMVAVVIGFALGIVAIVLALGVRRRIRSEPGVWRGRRRALAALWLGWGTVLGPALWFAWGLLRPSL